MNRNLLAPLLALCLAIVGCSKNQSAKPQASAGSSPALAQTAGDEAQGNENEKSVNAHLDDIDYSVEQYRVVEQPDLVCTVLKNGLTIIAKRIPSPVISVQGLCHTGSIYEGKWLGGGLSHLLEHLLAGGTNARRSEADNRNLLQNIGDNSNAYTSYDTTVFFVNTTADHLNDAVDLVTGWLFTAKIPQAEYKREYEVVQRELEKDNGEADWAFYQLATSNRYVLHPVRMPVVGYQDVIRGLSRDDVYAYYKQSYVPQNIVIGVAGNADPEEMVAAVRKYAGNVRPGRVPQKAVVNEPPVAAPRTAVATFPKLGQAKLEIAFPSVAQYHPDMYALDVLAAVLASGESSILVEEVRDKQHLVTAIAAGDNTPAFVDGSFAVDMELDVKNVKAATDAVLEQLEKIKKEGVSEERLKRAKTQLKAADAYQRQSAEAVSTTLVMSYIGTGYPEDVVLQNYLKVTPEQIKDVANRYFDRNKLLTTALIPAESVEAGSLPSAEKLLRQAVPTTQTTPKPADNPAVTRLELEDGTVVLLKRVATSPVVSVQLYSLGGITAEDAQTNGLGNLAMQTIERGSKTRSAEDIATFFDSVGGQFEATCGTNSWAWQGTFLKDDLPKGLEVFADLVHNPSFPDDEVKAVKERVLAAIESQDHDWRSGGNRYFRTAFFGPQNSPYQFTPQGTKANVEKFTPDDLKKWYGDKVLKGKRVLAIYGDIEIDSVRKLLSEHFAKPTSPQYRVLVESEQKQVPLLTTKSEPAVTVKDVKVQKWDNPEAAIFIGFDSRSLVEDSRRDPLVMADTLTSGFSYPTGYIFETLRGLGLVYEADAQNLWGLSDKLPGTFFAYAGCDPKNVDACIDQMLLNIARLQGTDKDIDPQWFARAQNMVTSIDAMENETAAAQATTAATDELYGLGYDYHAKFAERIKAVTIKEVRDTAKLRLRDCIIAVSTNAPDLVKAKPGERKYDSFPAVDLTPQGVQHDTGGPGAK